MVRRRFKPKESGPEPEHPTCEVRDCEADRDRSLPLRKVEKALPQMKWRRGLGKPKRVHLCRAHYREYRRATKEARQLERLGRG